MAVPDLWQTLPIEVRSIVLELVLHDTIICYLPARRSSTRISKCPQTHPHPQRSRDVPSILLVSKHFLDGFAINDLLCRKSTLRVTLKPGDLLRTSTARTGRRTLGLVRRLFLELPVQTKWNNRWRDAVQVHPSFPKWFRRMEQVTIYLNPAGPHRRSILYKDENGDFYEARNTEVETMGTTSRCHTPSSYPVAERAMWDRFGHCERYMRLLQLFLQELIPDANAWVSEFLSGTVIPADIRVLRFHVDICIDDGWLFAKKPVKFRRNEEVYINTERNAS